MEEFEIYEDVAVGPCFFSGRDTTFGHGMSTDPGTRALEPNHSIPTLGKDELLDSFDDGEKSGGKNGVEWE
jgi:hypothetical protein